MRMKCRPGMFLKEYARKISISCNKQTPSQQTRMNATQISLDVMMALALYNIIVVMVMMIALIQVMKCSVALHAFILTTNSVSMPARLVLVYVLCCISNQMMILVSQCQGYALVKNLSTIIIITYAEMS